VTSTIAAQRAFQTFPRGELREDAMRLWRNALRNATNPDTGAAFTEDEIAAATLRQSRWWIEADNLDLLLMSSQSRGLYLANQIRPDRAGSAFLEAYHSQLWRLPRLGAAGGSGPVAAPATVGSLWVGSTTVPNPAATWLRDPGGKRYQVLFTVAATAGGAGSGVDGAVVQLRAIDTGPDTNITAGTKLTYAQNGPLGSTGDPTVQSDFKDGASLETDAAWGRRIMDRIRHKPAAGNPAHFRAWGRDASVSVLDAYVYPCAFHAGSTLVVVTSKRGSVEGPTGLIPSVGTLSDVTKYLTPPGSPVVPRPPHVLVLPPTSQAADLVLSLQMRAASASGWIDARPWPEQLAGVATTITAVTDQQNFAVTIPAGSSAPPAGITPSLMVWDESRSRLEKLIVSSVTLDSGDVYDVVLASAPITTLATGQIVSPDNGRREVVAEAIEAFFDDLGPGEVVDLSTDDRAHRAFRFPEPFETASQRVGSGVLTYLRDVLQASVANEGLESVSSMTPTVPSEPGLGPALMVAGKVGIYAA
jgi:uncharacterized phage protein gp47/JayE